MIRTLLLRSARIGFAAFALSLIASAAPGLTLCIAPCDFAPPPPPTVVVPPPISLPPFVPPSLIALVPEGGDFEFVVEGDLRILLAGSALDAELLEVRSDVGIEVADGLRFAGTPLEFCAPDCVDPNATRIPGAPGQISIQLPTRAGALRLAATGRVTIQAGEAAVPEPTSALLLGIGFAVVAARSRTARR